MYCEELKNLRVKAILSQVRSSSFPAETVLKFEFIDVLSKQRYDDLVNYVGDTFEFELVLDDKQTHVAQCELNNGNQFVACSDSTPEQPRTPAHDLIQELVTLRFLMVMLCGLALLMSIFSGMVILWWSRQ